MPLLAAKASLALESGGARKFWEAMKLEEAGEDHEILDGEIIGTLQV